MNEWCSPDRGVLSIITRALGIKRNLQMGIADDPSPRLAGVQVLKMMPPQQVYPKRQKALNKRPSRELVTNTAAGKRRGE